MNVGLLMMMMAAAAAGADSSEEEASSILLFEPAIELGLIFHDDPTIGEGLLVRTSLELRFERVNAPFLRLSYDTATARVTRDDVGSVERLVANLALHDIVLGGGWRIGLDEFQVVGSVQLGVQIADAPTITLLENETVIVGAETSVAGLGLAGLGLEYYLSEEIALTAELSGRLRFSELDDAISPFALAFTLGLTTAL